MTFKVGQIILCIDDAPPRHAPDQVLCRPKTDERYTVRGLHFVPEWESYGVLLEEVINPSIVWADGAEYEMAFDARRFKPYDGLLRPVVRLTVGADENPSLSEEYAFMAREYRAAGEDFR